MKEVFVLLSLPIDLIEVDKKCEIVYIIQCRSAKAASKIIIQLLSTPTIQ